METLLKYEIGFFGTGDQIVWKNYPMHEIKKYSSNQDKRLDVHNIGVHVHLFCVCMVASFMTRCTACMHAQ